MYRECPSTDFQITNYWPYGWKLLSDLWCSKGATKGLGPNIWSLLKQHRELFGTPNARYILLMRFCFSSTKFTDQVLMYVWVICYSQISIREMVIHVCIYYGCDVLCCYWEVFNSLFAECYFEWSWSVDL